MFGVLAGHMISHTLVAGCWCSYMHMSSNLRCDNSLFLSLAFFTVKN